MSRQRYICFDPSTGKIIHTVYYQKEDLPESAKSVHLVVDADLVAEDYYVCGGVLVKKPDKPTLHHTFDYTTKQWVDLRTPETEWPLVRAKRDKLLLASDWTQLPDVPLTTKEMWANYRQALRDVTLQADPFNIVWPGNPA